MAFVGELRRGRVCFRRVFTQAGAVVGNLFVQERCFRAAGPDGPKSGRPRPVTRLLSISELQFLFHRHLRLGDQAAFAVS